MKSLQEQIKEKCIHFTGLGKDSCKAGILYADVKIPTKPIKIPCLLNTKLSGGTCDKCKFPTDDEAKAQANEIGKTSILILAARKQILVHIDSGGEREGVINCGNCNQNTLSYSQAQNGHIRANCLCGISFME